MAEFVPYTQRETYQLHNIPAAHMRNIRKRVNRQGASYADVVANVLAAQCGVPWARSGRRRLLDDLPWTTSLSVRVPVEVMNCIREVADREQITIRSAMLNALSDAFKLKRPPATHVDPGSRPGRRKEK